MEKAGIFKDFVTKPFYTHFLTLHIGSINLMKEILKQSWQTTTTLVKSNKKLVLLLFLLQLTLVVLLASHFFLAQLAIGGDLRLLAQEFQKTNLNPDELQEGKPFLQNPLTTLQIYNSLKRNILQFIFWFSLIFVAGEFLIWCLSHLLWLEKRWNIILNLLVKFLAATIFFLGLFFLGAYFLLKSQFLELDAVVLGQAFRYLAYAFLAVYYLYLVALTNLHLTSWKEFLQKWFRKAIINYYLTIPLLLLSLLPSVLTFSTLFYITQSQSQSSFLLMLISFLLFIFFLVVGRIFFLAMIKLPEPPSPEPKEPDKPSSVSSGLSSKISSGIYSSNVSKTIKLKA